MAQQSQLPITPRILMLFLIVDALVVLAIVGWFLLKTKDELEPSRSIQQLKTDLNTAEQALALLENERFSEATPLWLALCQNFPQDANLALNLAVCRLAQVEKQLREIEGSDRLSEAERQTLRSQIPELLAAAEKSSADALKLAPAAAAPNRIAAAVKLQVAKQQEYPADIELKKQAAAFILDALKRVPGDPVLAVQLHDLSEELGQDLPDLAKQSTDALLLAWQKLPRNLFLLQMAGDSLLNLQDQRISELIEPSLELNQPFMDQILTNAAGENPLVSVQAAKKDLLAGNYNQAELPLRQWFNLHRVTTAFSADRRFADPNILAMISLDTITQWRETLSERLSSQTPATEPALAWKEQPLPPLPTSVAESYLRHAIWFDIDLDLNNEVAWIQGNQLYVSKLPKRDAASWEIYSSVEINPSTTRFYAIDLFSVTVGDQPRIDANTAKASAQASGVSAADVTAVVSRRHDTLQDLVLVNNQGIQIITTETGIGDNPKRTLKAVTTKTGLEDIPAISAVEPIEIDGDGDLDLALIADGQVRFFQNNGNRTFKAIDRWSQRLPQEIKARQIIACDYDRDIDTDLLVACEGQHFGVLENLLHSQFRWRSLDGSWKQLDEGYDLAVAELDGNASWDWTVVNQNQLHSVLTQTPQVGEVIPTFHNQATLPARCTGLYLGDFNNDSWNDAIAWSSEGLYTIAGTTGGAWSQKSTSNLLSEPVRFTAVADVDRSGQLSLLVSADSGLKLFSSKPNTPSSFLDVRLKGVDDANGGGRVNHYGYGSTLELRAGERYLAQVVRQPVTHFGLGSINPIDNLRVIFTNGLTQSALAPKRESVIEEVQAPKGSCPFLYGWDGEKFVMITDLLWNAPLGLQIARGKVLPDRRWEYLILPGEKMQPKDGRYEIQITEELWEAAYFDEVRLIAVDHPAEIEVFTNEKVGPPDIASPRIFTASKKLYPVKAMDSAGRDWTEAIKKKDSIYAYGFSRNFCQGLVDKHYLEFDFGSLPEHQTAQLILTGWLFPTDTSLNIGLDDNPDLSPPEPPSLWLSHQGDEFRCIRPFMGFPGGKPKPIVIDLNQELQAGLTRLRIETSAQLHWDEAFLVLDEAQPELREQPLSLQQADLHYRGFSTLKPRTSEQPHWYDYQQLDPTASWPFMDGFFTTYGDVRELLQQDDNRLVVMGSGDEMTLIFASPENTLPPGWKRDFILYSTGWDKDADLNTLEGQSSLPLPFKEMRAYPPPVNQSEMAEEVWKLNQPKLKRQQSFRRFWKIANQSLR